MVSDGEQRVTFKHCVTPRYRLVLLQWMKTLIKLCLHLIGKIDAIRAQDEMIIHNLNLTFLAMSVYLQCAFLYNTLSFCNVDNFSF